jgi:hypothetical protein
MAFHEATSLKLTMGNHSPSGQTCNQRDLDTSAARNLRTEGYLSWCACFGAFCVAGVGLASSEAGRSSFPILL